MKGRLSLARIGARIKTMSLEEMKQYKDISFLQFMHSRGVTNQIILDVMQSAIYMAAGVGIERASAYEALRTLRDTDKESSKLASFKKLLFGIGIEYDEGVAIGGMLGLIERVTNAIAGDYVLGAPVEMIRQQGDLIRLRVAGKEIDHRLVVSNIPLSSMPNLVKAEKPEVSAFFERWSHLEPTYGLTLWLGLNQVVIGDRKSRVLVHPRPNRWILSLSSFDPSCAPEGKELVAIATVSDRSRSVEEQVQVIKENGLTDYIPGLLDHVEMEHVQTSYATRAALIPGQTDLDRPGPETPLKGLYIVGTDTAGSGVGLQQAANSADCVIRSLRSKF